jgi:flagellar L-ring protein precursor FlgH
MNSIMKKTTMRFPNKSTIGVGLLLASSAIFLAGCNTLTRLSEVGATPGMTQPQNPTMDPNYRPVSLPMPQPVLEAREPNSLWRTGSRAFFKDQRASRVGDLVTVNITIDDKATIANQSTRNRNNTENAAASSFFGWETQLGRIFPEAVNPASLVDLSAQTANDGKGTIDRKEQINLKVAAVITQLLPNGNMVVHGRQEVRVNYEVRELQIAGIIRPEDISSLNAISYEKIAEARIAYGGRGQISDFQQPRYGQQVLDIIMPF